MVGVIVKSVLFALVVGLVTGFGSYYFGLSSAWAGGIAVGAASTLGGMMCAKHLGQNNRPN